MLGHRAVLKERLFGIEQRTVYRTNLLLLSCEVNYQVGGLEKSLWSFSTAEYANE